MADLPTVRNRVIPSISQLMLPVELGRRHVLVVHVFISYGASDVRSRRESAKPRSARTVCVLPQGESEEATSDTADGRRSRSHHHQDA